MVSSPFPNDGKGQVRCGYAQGFCYGPGQQPAQPSIAGKISGHCSYDPDWHVLAKLLLDDSSDDLTVQRTAREASPQPIHDQLEQPRIGSVGP